MTPAHTSLTPTRPATEHRADPQEPTIPTDRSHASKAALSRDVRHGLRGRPKSLPPKWFYDQRGSELFDAITRLPEYYPTEAERTILRSIAGEVVGLSGADTVIELGAGTSDKTRTLLDAFAAAGRLQRFVPFDVSEEILADAARMLARRYPDIAIDAVVGDFEADLERLLGQDPPGQRLVLFLGSTIGNFDPAQRQRFLRRLCGAMSPGDSLLLGADLVKPVPRLLAAYNDRAGVTAEFNRNVLRVLNRELHAGFDPAAFEHQARWNPTEEWIEMHLVASRAHSVDIADLGLRIDFDAGESIHTEISAKFRERGLREELAAAGLQVARFWTDPRGDFSVSLSRAARSS